VVDVAAGPEILLTLLGHQTHELVLQGRTVERDWPHTVLATVRGSLALGERGASHSPRDKVVASSEPVVWLATAATATALGAAAALTPVASTEDVPEAAEEAALGQAADCGRKCDDKKNS